MGLTGRAWGQDLFPVVETTNGKLRGVWASGVASFKGVHYADSTAGLNRFMPPQPVKKWAGVKDALTMAEVAPQVPGGRTSDYGDIIVMDRQIPGIGEDCLSINIWTPSLETTAKKPVIMVIHGGGYYGGSGNSFGMDGDRMVRFSDCVVIAVNHRLGAMGFAHMEDFGGSDFASSGTVGMQDIVAALAWIKENIAEFGGDPDRVMVYGQSGGGAKTSNLLAMPSAKGLMHRAGVMSGSSLRLQSKEDALKTADAYLKVLGLNKGEVHKLRQLPLTTLVAAQAGMEAAMRAQGEAPRTFGPCIDGIAIPEQTWTPDAPDVSKDVPMVVSSALDERTYRMGNFDMTDEELLTFAKDKAGDRAAEAVALYKADDPDATPFHLAARMDTDTGFRRSAFTMAERKAAQGGAPVWTYLWTWPSPAYEGRYGAVHGIDVGLSLHSVRGGLTGASAESVMMADRIAGTWAAFAATGNPNSEYTPDWPEYTQETRATMIFDTEMKVENDPRAEFRDFWESM
ncbi:MAG: carboxylesterase [Ponticaulis sp.]|nr:carboxylesterase [Ponticaulis sp.]